MLRVKEGEPISLQLWDNGGNSVFVSGSIVEPAGSSPMLPMKLRENISKMGATPFVLADLQTDIDRYIYVNISEVNRVRRAACEALEAAILKNPSGRRRMTRCMRNRRSSRCSCGKADSGCDEHGAAGCRFAGERHLQGVL